MVCLGNICRSPLAEAALRQAAEKKKRSLHIDSAGTGAWHIGNGPDPRACAVAQRLGGTDIRHFRARQVRVLDFHDFDFVLAMDVSNLRDLEQIKPSGAPAQLSLLLDYLPGMEGQSVADPYYGTDADFETCWRQVQSAAEQFLEKLEQ